MNEPTFEYVEALIRHIVARSLKRGAQGAIDGIHAIYHLKAGFDANEETWKLDDRTHLHGKPCLRQLITNAIEFLKLNFGLDHLVQDKQYTCDIRFGIYEALDLFNAMPWEEAEEVVDEEIRDEADWK